MINRIQFEEICNKYGLDSKKLIKNNENVLEKADYNSICYVLDFLRDTLKVSPNNIEKCPSILYLKIEAIKENWNFLNEKKINTRDVATCLHILSTEPEQLKKTYEYVSDENRYGKKYIEQITTILRVPVERIQEIEEKCPELTKENILSAAISRKDIDEIKKIIKICQKNKIEVTGSVFKRTAEEIEKIVEVCQKNKIELTGSVFFKSAEEIEKIVEVCKKNKIELTGSVFLKSAEEIEKIIEVCKKNKIELTGSVFLKSAEEIEKIVEVCKKNKIELTGSVFKRTAEEIEKIVEVCKKNKIELTGSVFLKSAEEIEKIVEVCQKNKIKITGSVFLKNSKQLKENIEYIKQNYGEEYLTPLIVSKNLKHLQKTLPYLQSIGVLETIKTSASILSLTLEEIKERKAFIESIGEPIVKENKFNSIFGMPKKSYPKKVKEYEEKKKLIGKIKGAIQERQELDEQINSKAPIADNVYPDDKN